MNQLVGVMKFEGEYLTIGSKGVRDAFSVKPGLVYRANDTITAELHGTIMFRHYKAPLAFGGAAAADQDGILHGIRPTVRITVPNTTVQLHIRYEHWWNVTDGGSFDYEEDGISPRVTVGLPLQFDADFAYWRIWRNYGELGPRGDDINIYNIQVTRPVYANTRWYFEYVHVDSESNGIAFEYRQNVLTTGVILTF